MLSADDPSEMLAIISITAPDTAATAVQARIRFNASLKSMALTPSSVNHVLPAYIVPMVGKGGNIADHPMLRIP